jgi:hypothetical protein
MYGLLIAVFCCGFWGSGPMTLRIERSSSGRKSTIRLVGQVESEHLDELKAQIEDGGSQVALDLDEVTLVDVEAVHFLIACEAKGAEVLNCPRYIREWMLREQAAEG